MDDRSVLITGGSGFVGGALVSVFAERGWRGVVSSRSGAQGGARALPPGWRRALRGELLDGSDAFAPDLFVHLEVKQHVFHPTAEDLADFTSVNVKGTEAWLDWCAARGVKRFVFLSTIKAVEPEGPGPVDETTPVRPGSTPYGRSKWEAEARVRAWAAADPERSALILRPAVVYGPGNEGNIAAMVEGIDRGRFCLVGANTNRKALVSLRNLAAAVRHLAEQKSAGCETYFVTDAETLSVREIAEAAAALLGGRRVPTIPPAAARLLAGIGDVFGRITGRTFPINGSRLRALLEETDFRCGKLVGTGFRHPQTFREGMREMIAARAASSEDDRE